MKIKDNIVWDKKLNKYESIIFIIYSYVKISILQNIMFDQNYSILDISNEQFGAYFNSLFDIYNSEKDISKNILKTTLKHSSFLDLSNQELESLIEMIDFFYSNEYMQYNNAKCEADIWIIVKDLLNIIIAYGKFPINSSYPFWIEYNSIFNL